MNQCQLAKLLLCHETLPLTVSPKILQIKISTELLVFSILRRSSHSAPNFKRTPNPRNCVKLFSKMPKIPKPDDIPKFTRGTVDSASQKATAGDPMGSSTPVPNPVASTQALPDTSKAEGSPSNPPTQQRSGARYRKKRKAKKPPEQNVEQRAEVLDGHVRRGIFDAMNMPLEGEPALERYLMPEEVATTEVSPTENTSSSALHDQPEPEHNVESPEDENDVKREEASTSAAILVGAVGAQQSFDIPPASRDHAEPEASCEPQGNKDKCAHIVNCTPMARRFRPAAQFSKWLFPA